MRVLPLLFGKECNWEKLEKQCRHFIKETINKSLTEEIQDWGIHTKEIILNKQKGKNLWATNANVSNYSI